MVMKLGLKDGSRTKDGQTRTMCLVRATSHVGTACPEEQNRCCIANCANGHAKQESGRYIEKNRD